MFSMKPLLLKRITLSLTLGALLFLLSASFAFAQQTGPCQETRALLPILPGSQGLDPCSSPAAYVVYWFYLSLYLAGIAALLVLVFAGVTRLVSGFMPSAVSGANKMVTNAALGLILLFSGWLLLNTLNPSLLSIGNSSFPPLGGCTMRFLPDRVAANQSSKLAWSLFFEKASYGILTCAQPRPGINQRKVALYDDTSYTSDIEGLHSCTLTAFDSQDRGAGICRASLVVTSPCELTWSPAGPNSNRGTLAWRTAPGATRAVLQCDKGLDCNKLPQGSCILQPPGSGSVILDKSSFLSWLSSSTGSCVLNITNPWENFCRAVVTFP